MVLYIQVDRTCVEILYHWYIGSISKQVLDLSNHGSREHFSKHCQPVLYNYTLTIQFCNSCTQLTSIALD